MKESQPSPNRLVPLWTNRARTMLYFIWYQEGLTWNERGSYYRIVSLFTPPPPFSHYYHFCLRTLEQKTRASLYIKFRYAKFLKYSINFSHYCNESLGANRKIDENKIKSRQSMFMLVSKIVAKLIKSNKADYLIFNIAFCISRENFCHAFLLIQQNLFWEFFFFRTRERFI